MKMGIKEFRERMSEVFRGDEPVLITHHGNVVARVTPVHGKPAEAVDVDEWLAQIERAQADWRTATPDWRDRLAAFGLGPDGEPIAPCD